MRILYCFILVLAIFAGCGKDKTPVGKPLIFWHGLNDQKALVLREIIGEYNNTHPPVKVQEEYAGNYNTLYQKTMTVLLAKQPPDLATAYESMVADYMRYNAVVDLGPYLEKEVNKGSDLAADIYPVFLETNRYQNFGNQLLSMPFTKSILMLYYNADMLAEVGQVKPPATWDEFLAVCRQIKQKKGIVPLAFSRDASTFDAFVFSFGGDVYDPKTDRPIFDKLATIKTLTLIRDLFRDKLAQEIAYDTFDDRNDFAQQQVAFFIRSSTSRPYVAQQVKNKFKWNMASIPHARDVPSRTVLFGMNICVFQTTPQRQEAAWGFIRYFLSRNVTAQWATRTGYLPVRKSALEVPALKEFLGEHPANRQTIDAIPFAYSEPNVRGWQEVRPVIEQIMSDVINQRKTPDQASQSLQQATLRILF
ncbi:MAG: ABC transporter substrate-binding protein [Phycisphaerae bacterium]